MKNYHELLGGIVKNKTGHIISATTLQSFYNVFVNFTAVDMDKSGNIAGTADFVSLIIVHNSNNKIYININI